jgi:hypothetical protein
MSYAKISENQFPPHGPDKIVRKLDDFPELVQVLYKDARRS